MRISKNLPIVSVIAIVLCSCAFGPPTQQELNSAYYGSQTTQDNAKKLVQDFMAGYLKDPGSAQYQWETVDKGWVRHAPVYGSGLEFGYKINVQVNAKNSYGGYIGYKPYKFLIRDGSIVTVYGYQTIKGGGWYMGKIY